MIKILLKKIPENLVKSEKSSNFATSKGKEIPDRQCDD